MNVIQQNHKQGPFQTGKLMHWLAHNYKDDLIPYSSMTPREIYDHVKQIPYGFDPRENECVSRPKFTLEGRTPWTDCDDKAVVLGAYARLKNIPYRFIAIGSRPKNYPWYKKTPLSHVYNLFYLNNQWIPLDATYNFNSYGVEMGPYDRHAFI